jgi:predicted ATPase
VLIRESEVQPLLVVCEDLDWIDTETQAILGRMIESLPTARIALLVTYRPDYQHLWGGKTSYTQLRLDPLPPAGAQAFMQVLLGDDPSLAPLTRLLCEQTRGNPFFLEESVQTLIETGVLLGEPEGYHLVHPYNRLQVPTTVQAVLAARLDRLARPDQKLLHVLSVLGHESSLRLITEVVGEPEAAVRQRLTHRQCAEFVDERLGRPEPVYTFKHALTQEVAYQAVPMHMRHQSHFRVAQVLEARYPETCETQPERLAHHYMEAGLIAQAIPYWQKAGQRALERSASVEAIGHLTKGLVLLKSLPDTPDHLQQDLALQTALGSALMASKDHASPEVEQVYVRARELYQLVGDTAPLSSVLWGLWHWYVSRAELQTARELGEQLLSIAQSLHDSGLLLLAHCALEQTWF